MKIDVKFGLSLALIFAVASSGVQALGLPKLKLSNKPTTTTTVGQNHAGPKTTGLTPVDQLQFDANKKRAEIADFLFTLHGQSYSQAKSALTKKYGVAPRLEFNTGSTWTIPFKDPYCVDAMLNINTVKGVISSSSADLLQVGYHRVGEEACIEALKQK